MATTKVVLFKESDGSVPLLLWLDAIPPKAQDKCIVRVERLKELGHQIRRPEADYLRDGVYELRARLGNVHYRMLYFFCGKDAVISHGLMKEHKIPEREIALALDHRVRFEQDPKLHTCEG
jgi:phage-related protein